MFNLFKRTKVKAWERQLLVNIFSALPAEFHYLKEQVEEGIHRRVVWGVTVIPNYVGFSYNGELVDKFERRKDNGFEVIGIKVYDEVSKSFIDFNISVSHGLVAGYSTPNNEKISLDVNKLDTNSLQIVYNHNPLYDKIKPLLTQVYINAVSPDDVYEVELDGKIYYHLKSLEDVDFIGIDKDGKYYEITHHPYEVKEIDPQLNATEKYKLLFSKVEAILKAEGFTKKGSTFYLRRENNFGLINLQRSSSNTKDRISFTINIGVASQVLLNAAIYDIKTSDRPSVWDCHWQERIGSLMPIKKDYWWKIVDNSQIDEMTKEVILYLQTLAIPEVKNNISDDALITMWMGNENCDISTLVRYRYLIILLKAKKDERLQVVVEEFKEFGKQTNDIDLVAEYIKEFKLSEE